MKHSWTGYYWRQQPSPYLSPRWEPQHCKLLVNTFRTIENPLGTLYWSQTPQKRCKNYIVIASYILYDAKILHRTFCTMHRTFCTTHSEKVCPKLAEWAQSCGRINRNKPSFPYGDQNALYFPYGDRFWRPPPTTPSYSRFSLICQILHLHTFA